MDKEKLTLSIIMIAIGALAGIFYMANYYGVIDEIRMDFKIGEKITDVDEIIDICRESSDSIKQLTCVNTQIEKVHNYTKAHIGVQDMDYTLENGGVCKDYAKIWAYVADELGYENEYILTQHDGFKHVFNVISFGDGYCVADQSDIKCKRLQAG